MKRGACLCICSPLGRSLLPGLKSSKQSPLTSKKNLDHMPAALLSSSFTVYVCQTPFPVSLQLFIFLQSSNGAAPWQGPVFPLPYPSFKLSSLVSAHTSRRHSSSPSHPRREATVDRMLCCGEPAANGKRRRE